MAVAARIAESTPQEREVLGRHLIAIYNLLKGVAERRQETSHLPPLPMLPAPQEWNELQSGQNDGMQERFRRSMQQFGQTIRRYKRNFTAEERRAVIAHLNEIREILTDIDRRVRNQTAKAGG
jgi:hypothetical protein